MTSVTHIQRYFLHPNSLCNNIHRPFKGVDTFCYDNSTERRYCAVVVILYYSAVSHGEMLAHGVFNYVETVKLSTR